MVKKKSTYKKKGRDNLLLLAWYSVGVNNLTITEFARLGGRARAKKLSKKRRKEISDLANEALRKKRALDKRKN